MRLSCRKNYFETQFQTLPLLDVVTGVRNEETSELKLFFPYPFQILGTAAVNDWVAPPPYSELPMPEQIVVDLSGVQVANYGWLMQMFSVMMYANRDKGMYHLSPFLGSIQYEEKAFAKMSNYFYSYLNDQTKDFFYKQFIFPSSIIFQFWLDQVTKAAPQNEMEELLELCSKLFNISDRRLWGAPGLYTLYLGDLEPGDTSEELTTESIIIGSIE